MSTHFRVRHETTYRYDNEVALAHNRAALTPRRLPQQQLRFFELLTVPDTGYRDEATDWFGNTITWFSIERPHRELTIVSRAEVVLGAASGQLSLSGLQPWEAAAAAVGPGAAMVDDAHRARIFVHDSALVEISPELAAYARVSFAAGRSLIDAASDLTGRIFTEFTYRPGATTIGTTVTDVLRRRAGVCQDFAHLQLACLRAMGLAARYVSGYLETQPAPGQPKLVGADASHAWCSVRQADGTWLDLDPTNNLVGPTTHITLAWGRDYSDVAPLSGVIFAGRVGSVMDVAVDIQRVAQHAEETDALH